MPETKMHGAIVVIRMNGWSDRDSRPEESSTVEENTADPKFDPHPIEQRIRNGFYNSPAVEEIVAGKLLRQFGE